MKVQILSGNEVQKDKWNDLIINSKEGNVYALYQFLMLCERDWKAVILLDKDTYFAGIPVQFKATFFYPHVYQDPFARELGLYCQVDVDFSVLAQMLFLAFSEYKLVSGYSFNVDNTPFVEQQRIIPHQNLSQNTTYYLNLNRPYTEVKAAYSTNRKRDLKKAEQQELLINTSADFGALVSIFRSFTAKKVVGFEDYQYEILARLYGRLIKDGIGELYHVLYEGEVISAVFIARFRNKIVYLFGAHSEKAFEVRSSTLVLDHIIKKYSGQDYIFDFEGSDDPDLARYYSSFGSEKRYFYRYEKNELPPIIQAAKNLRKNIVKKLKG